jgi:hypothetical protein
MHLRDVLRYAASLANWLSSCSLKCPYLTWGRR